MNDRKKWLEKVRDIRAGANATMMMMMSLVWFYGISTIVGYLMPILFLYIETVLFQTIQFNIITQFKCKKKSFISNNSV